MALSTIQTPSQLFGAKVAHGRRALGIGQRALAKAVGICPSNIAQIEHGQPRPALRTVRRLCALLRLSDPAAWTLAMTGRLPVAVTLDQAHQILDGIGYQPAEPEPDRQRLLARITRRRECRMCQYAWTPRSANPPARCPHCHSRFWRGTTPEQMRLSRAQSVRSKAGWRTKRERENAEPLVRSDARAA